MTLSEFYSKGIEYQEYMSRFEKAVEEGKTSGPIQTEEYVFYTKLNWRRSYRLQEHTHWLEPSYPVDLSRYSHLAAICLTEFWCGDAAQNIPVIEHVASDVFGLSVRYLFRDEHPELMDANLTNGGRSIPKYILFELRTGEEVTTWGPRPQKIQAVVNSLKETGISKEDMMEEVQKAYNADKSISVQQEWFDLLHKIND